MTSVTTGSSRLAKIEAVEKDVQDAHRAYRVAIDAFGDVASQLGQIEDIDELLHLIASKICALVGVGRCSIHLRDENGMYHGCIGHAGKDIDARVKRARAGMPADGVTLEVLRTRAPVIVSDARNDPRPVPSTIRYWGIRSYMAVPMTLGGEVIGLVFLDEEDEPHQFTTTDCAIAAAFADLAAVAVSHTQVTTELRTKLKAANRQTLATKQAAKTDAALTDIVVKGGDLHDVVTALADQLGKPVAIHAADARPLAVATPPGAPVDVVPHLLEPQFQALPDVINGLAVDEGRPARLVGPLLDAGLHHRYLVAPVTVRGEFACWIVVMEHRSRLNMADMLIAQRAATLVGLQMTMERTTTEADWSAGASLVAALVGGNAEPQMLRRRAEHVGLALHEPHRICVLAPRDDHAVQLDPLVVVDAFATLAPDRTAFAARVGDEIAVVIAEGDDPHADDLARVAEAVCESLKPEAAMAAGISVACSDAAGYPAAYLSARQSVTCVQKFVPADGPATLRATDLGPSRLFLASVDPEQAADFAETAFGALLKDPSAGVMLSTLRAFFADNTNIRACSQRLDVHENTVRYRLTRIGQLTGLPVTSDPDGQLTARLALLVLDLRGTAPGLVPSNPAQRTEPVPVS